MTQEERIKMVLRAEGRVDRNWALKNYISRLGAIIHRLKGEGWEIEGKWSGGNYEYVLISAPQKPELSEDEILKVAMS